MTLQSHSWAYILRKTWFESIFEYSLQHCFTVAKTWQQPKYSRTEEWIQKMWYIYTMGCYSAIKRNKIGSFLEMQIDLESVLQNEVSQKEKNKYCILTHICGIQKNGTDDPICKAEIDTNVQNIWVPRVGGIGRLGLTHIYY